MSSSARQVFPVFIAALILVSQLAFPPIVGLADNGDYVNVIGPLHIVPANPVTGFERHFGFVIPVWRHDPNEPAIVRLYTSTLLPTAALVYTATPFTGGLLGLRLVGLMHSAIFLVALWLIAPIINTPAVWIAILAAFCDVAYFSYFNSFYMDTGSFLFLMLSAAFYARIAAGRGGTKWNMAGWMVSILLLLTSKLQHTFLLAPLICLLFFDKRIRAALPLKHIAAYVLLLCAAVWGMYQRVPGDYRAMAAYNVVFSDLLPNATDQKQLLSDLGLPVEMTTFNGTDAFGVKSGLRNKDYRRLLLQRLSHFKLLGYYLRHPEVTVRLIESALKDGAYERHFGHGNFTPAAGRPPAATSHAFALVSDTRRALFENRPWLYAAYMIAIAAGLLWVTQGAVPSLILIAMAGLEFFLSALADCKETGRHLFFFRALMDLALAVVIYQLLHRTRHTMQPAKTSDAAL